MAGRGVREGEGAREGGGGEHHGVQPPPKIAMSNYNGQPSLGAVTALGGLTSVMVLCWRFEFATGFKFHVKCCGGPSPLRMWLYLITVHVQGRLQVHKCCVVVPGYVYKVVRPLVLRSFESCYATVKHCTQDLWVCHWVQVSAAIL
jgi:hypothetical protein